MAKKKKAPQTPSEVRNLLQPTSVEQTVPKGSKTEPAPKVAEPKRKYKAPTEGGIVKPLVEMTPNQRETAVYEHRESEGQTAAQPRSRGRNIPLRGARPSDEGVRTPTNPELRRGVTAVPTDKSKRKKAPKTRTKTGKRIDPKTGKIAAPKVGQIGKVDGKVVRVTPENVQQVHQERVRTVLPEAGPEEMRPQTPGPRVPLEAPEGGLREKVWIDSKTGKSSRKLKGFGVPAEQVHSKAWEAMGHLDSMMNHQPGSPEHTKHRESFVRSHGELHPMSADAHQILSMAAIIASRPKYPQQTSHLNQIKDALSERISIGRAMEKRRAQAQKGNRG